MKNIMLFGLVIFFLISCKKDTFEDVQITDSLDLIQGERSYTLLHSTISFDSLTDFRCPEGVSCTWEGNAKISLDLVLQGGDRHTIELNTYKYLPYSIIDTTINNLYISLSELTPYPKYGIEINPKDYRAKLTIAIFDKIKSNAKLLGYNYENCECCSGWTIKMGNDTIKSDDYIISRIIGRRNIEFPVDVYLELGDLKETCSDLADMDYYDIDIIIKPQ